MTEPRERTRASTDGVAWRRALAGVTSMLAAGALAAGLTACGSGTDSSTSSTTVTTTNAGTGPDAGGRKAGPSTGPGAPPKSRTAHPSPRHRHQGPPGSTMHHTYPGHILRHGLAVGGPVQPAELWPVTNGWEISDHRTLTAVYAGADPQHRSTGRLVVFRQNFVRVTQTSHRVDVPGAGPLEITRAPQGNDAQTTAQRSGNLEFSGRSGTSGTLHLKDDTVTVGTS